MNNLTDDLKDIFQQNPSTHGLTLGDLISRFLNLAVLLAGFLMLIWLVWGAMQYIFAGGDKEELAHARSRMIYAIVGFVIVILAYSVKLYIQNIVPQINPVVKTVTPP